MDDQDGPTGYGAQHFLKMSDGGMARTESDIEKFVFGYIMTQMSARKGIQKHGRRTKEALMKELAQLRDKSVFEAIDAASLIKEQKQTALREISVIKEKKKWQPKRLNLCRQSATEGPI